MNLLMMLWAQSLQALLKPLLKQLDFHQSAKVAKIVAQDIKDGQTLKVRATPEFFVNGRPLINFGYEQLIQLVDEAVNEAYK